MNAMTLRKNDDKKFICEFCNRQFVRETMFVKHVCPKKQRWLRKDDRDVTLGFYAYEKFYKESCRIKKTIKFDEFIDSKFFSACVRFGKFVIQNASIQPDRYLKWIFDNQIPIDNWSDYRVYEKYLKYIVQNENHMDAAQRTLNLMKEWSIQENKDFAEFFKKISTPLAVQWIKTGRISPWVLFCTKGGQELLDRFNEEEFTIITNTLDVDHWQKKFALNKDYKEEIREIFAQANM